MSLSLSNSIASAIQALKEPEVLRALTPGIMTLAGGLIGVVAVVVGGDTAAFGLAGTAIAGAAGLSQTHESRPQPTEETLVHENLENNALGGKK